jgi:hypothetical protein
MLRGLHVRGAEAQARPEPRQRELEIAMELFPAQAQVLETELVLGLETELVLEQALGPRSLPEQQAWPGGSSGA